MTASLPRHRRPLLPAAVPALVDQAAYTGANFVGALLLAASAGVEALGRYALIASVSALLHSLFVGAVLEPLTSFGTSDRNRTVRFAYARVGTFAALTALALAAVVGVAGKWFASDRFIDVGAGLALFAGQAVVIAHKRHLYVVHDVRRAAIVSTAYAISLVVLVLAAVMLERYSAFALVLSSGIASAIASGHWCWRVSRMRMSIADSIGAMAPSWHYSAWTLLTSIPAVLAVQGLYWVADLRASRVVVGQLKLCEQLFAPATQVINTLGLLDQVKAVAEFTSGRLRSIRQLINRATVRYAYIVLAYGAVLTGATMLGRERFPEVTTAFIAGLAAYGVSVLLLAAAVPRNVAHKACREPRPIAVAYTTMASAVVLLSLVAPVDNLAELAAILAAGWLVHALILERSARRLLRKSSYDAELLQ